MKVLRGLASLGLLSVLLVSTAIQPANAGVLCRGQTPDYVGTSASEYIIGTSGNDVIHGAGGRDVILGFGGVDTLCGGRGDDRLDGGSKLDTLVGGPGTADECVGSPAEHEGGYHFGCEFHLPPPDDPPPPPPPPSSSRLVRMTGDPAAADATRTHEPGWWDTLPWCEESEIHLDAMHVRGAYQDPVDVFVQGWFSRKTYGQNGPFWAEWTRWGGAQIEPWYGRSIPSDGTKYRIGLPTIGTQPESRWIIGYFIAYNANTGTGQPADWRYFWDRVDRYAVENPFEFSQVHIDSECWATSRVIIDV